MYYTYYSPKECSDGNEEQRIWVNSDLSAKTVETNLSADNLYVGTNDAIGICVLVWSVESTVNFPYFLSVQYNKTEEIVEFKPSTLPPKDREPSCR